MTAKPTEQFEGSLTAEAGNYKTYNLEGYVSGGLGDRVQGRAAFRSETSDKGWQVSNSRGERLGKVRRDGWRLSLAMQPTDTVEVEASYSGWLNKSDTVAAQGIGFTPATAASPFNAPGIVSYIAANKPTKAGQADWAPLSTRGADIGVGLGIKDPLREDDQFHAGKLKISWDVADKVRLVSLTSFNRLERKAVFDWSGAPYEVLIQKAHGDIKSFAEELHLEGVTDKGSWLVGGYIARDKIYDSNRTLLGQNANVGTIRYVGSTLLATPFNSFGYTALQMSQAFRTYEDVGNIETKTWSLARQPGPDLHRLGHPAAYGSEGLHRINAAGQSQSFDGRPFLYSPKFQGGLTALFKQPVGDGLELNAALNGRWQDKSYADLEGNPLFVIDGYGMLNASVGIGAPDKGWDLSIWGRNITNAYYWSAVSSNANVVVRFPGKPTTYGASLTWKF
uniref:TonB-dependent receptor n=1 Tax=uncultured Caulobacter sp. TaxID=158749 RepID=UPI0025E75B14|nr:TonB-dependent receptor [uncultured Caulobacter sp.]